MSTNCDDLKKKVNLTLQLITEWLQINQLVLNKNKTFVINSSFSKTDSYPKYNIW